MSNNKYLKIMKNNNINWKKVIGAALVAVLAIVAVVEFVQARQNRMIDEIESDAALGRD